jgi:putative transposase
LTLDLPSFVHTFKTELVADRPWRSRSELELAIAAWVGWYNQRRLHSSLGDVSPSPVRWISLPLSI